MATLGVLVAVSLGGVLLSLLPRSSQVPLPLSPGERGEARLPVISKT